MRRRLITAAVVLAAAVGLGASAAAAAAAPLVEDPWAGEGTATTAYRYRVVATNLSGTAFGPALSFTTTETQPVFALPDGRAWEMVSPPEKGGGEVQGPGELFGGGVFQAAAAAPAVTYGSRSS